MCKFRDYNLGFLSLGWKLDGSLFLGGKLNGFFHSLRRKLYYYGEGWKAWGGGGIHQFWGEASPAPPLW